jgi:hypothetical protein
VNKKISLGEKEERGGDKEEPVGFLSFRVFVELEFRI